MNEIETLIMIGVVFLVYFLPMLGNWLIIRWEFNTFNRVTFSNEKPGIEEVVLVLIPGYNLVFFIFKSVALLLDAIENSKFDLSKFFKL